MRKRLISFETTAIFFILLGTFFVYRDVFFKNKVVFPSNFLAAFYSPWATMKFPQYPAGIPYKPIGGNDNVRMFYPYRSFINESLSRRQFPLWNPYNFSGSPLLADFQSAVFYPLNIIYFFLPQMTAWSLLVVIQPVLGTVFMYLYLRLFIKVKASLLMGAVSFGFSGFLIVWSMENAVVGQTVLWFPLILLLTEKFAVISSIKYFVPLVITLAVCLIAGHFQWAFYIFAVTLIYGLIRINSLNKTKKFRRLSQLVLAYFFCFLLVSVQLLPSIEAFYHSARSTTSIEPLLNVYILPLKYLVKVLAPDIFGNPASGNYFGQGFYNETVLYAGIIPVVFAAFSVLKLRKNKIVSFFLWTTFISLLFGIKSPFSDWFYRLSLPLITTFTPSRIFFVTSTGLSILSAFGLSYWLNKRDKTSSRIISLTSLVFIVILLFFAGIYYLTEVFLIKNMLLEFFYIRIKPNSLMSVAKATTSLRNIVLPVLMVLSLIPLTYLKYRKIAGFLIVLIFFTGQLYFLNKYLVLGDQALLYPEHFIFSDILSQRNKFGRFVSFGLPIAGNVAMEKKAYSPDGIDPVFSRRYGQLIEAAKNGGRYTNDIDRIAVDVSGYSDNYKSWANDKNYRLLNLLSVTRIYNYENAYKDQVNFSVLFPESRFLPVWNRDGWQAYENKNANPKAFLADSYLVEAEPQKSLDEIFNPANDLEEIVILEEEPGISGYEVGSDNGEVKSATITDYRAQSVKISVETDKPRLLFLSDNYYPGWVARIDGNKTKIYRADFAFRAVTVPQGKHTVTFSFEPDLFKIGSVISATTLLLLVMLFIMRNNFKKLFVT